MYSYTKVIRASNLVLIYNTIIIASISFLARNQIESKPTLTLSIAPFPLTFSSFSLSPCMCLLLYIFVFWSNQHLLRLLFIFFFYYIYVFIFLISSFGLSPLCLYFTLPLSLLQLYLPSSLEIWSLDLVVICLENWYRTRTICFVRLTNFLGWWFSVDFENSSTKDVCSVGDLGSNPNKTTLTES